MEEDAAIVSIISLKEQCHEMNNFLKALKKSTNIWICDLRNLCAGRQPLLSMYSTVLQMAHSAKDEL
jgi:hypothetical protein